jgi:hypothetical protein
VTTVGAGATAYSGPAGDNSTRASLGFQHVGVRCVV